MANAVTEITLDQVHDGIKAAIQAQFPDLRTVEAYRLDRHALKAPDLPACLFELVEMDGNPEEDPGTEQLSVRARFEAYLTIGFRQGTKNPKLEIRKLAAAFAAWLRLNRFGCRIGPAEVIGAYPDDFAPEAEQFECWRVEWVNVIHLGNTVWKDTGTPPERVYLGFAPNTSPDHIADYVQIAGPTDGE